MTAAKSFPRRDTIERPVHEHFHHRAPASYFYGPFTFSRCRKLTPYHGINIYIFPIINNFQNHTPRMLDSPLLA